MGSPSSPPSPSSPSSPRSGQPDPADATAVQRRLAIYLNDHLAGATTGVELAKRLAREHRGSQHGEELAQLATEIEVDRHSLARVMSELGISARRYKAYSGWATEKFGRLKSNGRLVRRARLSTVVELEAMLLGVEGKALLWQTLRRAAAHDPRLDEPRLDELITRAHHQSDTLRALHAATTTDLLTGAP